MEDIKHQHITSQNGMNQDQEDTQNSLEHSKRRNDECHQATLVYWPSCFCTEQLPAKTVTYIIVTKNNQL